MNILQANAATVQGEELEKIYKHIVHILQSIKSHETLITMENWDAKIEIEKFEELIGESDLGKNHERKERLV